MISITKQDFKSWCPNSNSYVGSTKFCIDSGISCRFTVSLQNKKHHCKKKKGLKKKSILYKSDIVSPLPKTMRKMLHVQKHTVHKQYI